jgi:hypothetical protein
MTGETPLLLETFYNPLTQLPSQPASLAFAMKYKTLLLTALLATGLSAQDAQPADSDVAPGSTDPYASSSNDPFSSGLGRNSPPADPVGPPFSICAELFSLSLEDGAALRRKQLSDQDLYQAILEKVEDGSSKQENLTILRGRFEESITTESIVEEIYPTEYEPPSNLGDGNISSALATAFETRNTGLTMEFQAKLNDDQTVSLRFAPEFVNLVDRRSWGEDSAFTEMPVFESQRINTSLKLKLEQPALAGTINRPPQSQIDENASKEVWLAFVTISLVKS